MAWYINLLQLNNMYPNEIMKRREFIKFSIATSTIPLWYKNASAAEPITMQAAWINDAEFAGYFIAIDEAQLCADPERGHIFTDKLLHARGYIETIFLGSSSMENIVSKMFPESKIIQKESQMLHQ